MSLKSLFVLSGAAVAAAILSLPADAQRPGRGGGMAALEAVDTNGDSIITQAEVDAARAAAFARSDSNGDGQVTQEEMTAARQAQKEQRRQARAGEGFAALDTNGDGGITLEEFGARSGDMFTRLDTNADGQLTAEERKAARRGPGRGKRGGVEPETAPAQ